MTTSQIVILVAIIIYLVGMVVIGALFTKKNKSSDDFYLGGRKLGPFVTAMSAEASDMSGWLLMGLPGVAYWCGLADAAWTAIGLAIGTYFNWLIVSRRLRRYSVKVDAITLPGFFSKRFHEKNKIILIIHTNVFTSKTTSTITRSCIHSLIIFINYFNTNTFIVSSFINNIYKI